MKLKSKFRKAETLAEAVVAIAVFGIFLLGLTDFMAAQINYVARTHYRDELINKAMILQANDVFNEIRLNSDKFTKDFTSGDNYAWSNDKKILTVKDIKVQGNDGVGELQFALP